MLNIGRLGPDGADYYLSQVVSGVEDYYTGSGEAPGYWLGSESEALGLVGRSARRLHLRLARGYQHAAVFVAALERLRALPAFA